MQESEIQKIKSTLKTTRSELEKTRGELIEAQVKIAAMETSKFWQLRQQWFKVRKKLGFTDDDRSLSWQLVVSSICEKIRVKKIDSQPWPSNKPLVSVVITCYNYGQFLEAAIDSVLEQTWKNLEIIVVDDGSTDPQTIEVLNLLKKPKTKIIRQTNQKLPTARNNGIKKARGKYICCLDADDLLKPTYLEKCLIKMETENLDLCYSWLEEFGDINRIWQMPEFDLEKLMNKNCCIVSTVFKRSIWKQVGGFDAKMIDGYEDWDFWLKIAEEGGIGNKIDEPLFLYRKHGRSMIDDAREKDQLLCEKIKSNHRNLYENLPGIKNIINVGKKYLVDNGYLNLKNNLNPGKNNILFLIPYTIVGGAETVALHLVKGFKQANYNVTVVTTLPTTEMMGDISAEYEAVVGDIYHFPKLFSSQDRWEELLFYLLESRNINLIFFANSLYGYQVLPKIKERFPHLKIINPIYAAPGYINDSRQCAEYIDLTVIESEYLQEIVADYAPNPLLIHNGVDTSWFSQEQVDISEEVVLKKIPQDKFIISFIGRFGYEKNPKLFVEIVNLLRERDNLYFVMAGNGMLYEETKKLISKYQLEERIFLPGFVDPRKFLKISNLLIVTSLSEGRPNIVLESLSMGVPVVTSAVGGLFGLIENEYNGFLCESENADNFAFRIEQILENQNLYIEMKKNARKYAVEKLDVKIMQEKYLEVAQNLLEKK